MKTISPSILRLNAILLAFVFSSSSFAQETAATTPKISQVPEMFFDPVTYIWMLLAFILFLTIIVLSSAINQLSRVITGETKSCEITTPVRKVKGPSTWSRLINSMARSVPVEKEKDVMLDHNYDGIQELDNQLPPWWKYGFYLTILFSIGYLTVYHISGSGMSQKKEYADELNRAEEEKKLRMTQNAAFVTDENVTEIKAAEALAEGKNIFSKNCAACHGDKGQGIVGPNLTDEFWLHGGGIKNVFHTINEGVPAKGMIAWKSQLSPKNIQLLASYILSINGTHPEGAKEPQGDKWEIALNDSAQNVPDTIQKKIVAAK